MKETTDRSAIGKRSRRKGKGGELEFCRLCKEHGWNAHRSAQFKGKTGQASDVEGLFGLHVEVKRTERFDLYGSLDQSRRDAEASGIGEIPIVAHRRNDCRWVVVLDAHDFFRIYNAAVAEMLSQEPVKRTETEDSV